MGKCLYCDSGKDPEHFLCDICEDGMCDDCYVQDKEHEMHVHMPLEIIESEVVEAYILSKCISEEPDYVCYPCLEKAHKEAFSIGK